MRPTLARGDWVLARPAGNPRPGDVALLDASGWLEIHRLEARVSAGGAVWYVHVGDAGDACGVARREEILAVIPVPSRRPRPAAEAHAAGLVLRLGALLWFLGLYPGRRVGRSVAGAFRRAVEGAASALMLFIERHRNSG